jgi:hypothetical protein
LLWSAAGVASLRAQDPPAPAAKEIGSTPVDGVEAKAKELLETGEAKLEELSKEVDADPHAKEITAGILQPIYQVAEYLGFAAFHWLAFALMTTGVVSYALQLVLAKLVVLTRLHLSFSEILADALGLVISVIGLVLTTQAAAENSSFTQSPASVLSATAAGVVLGFIFYLWGQALELRAAKGAKVEAKR